MNAPDKLAHAPALDLDGSLALTRTPFPASTKSHIVGSRPDIRVPVRDIALTNGEVVSARLTPNWPACASSSDASRAAPSPAAT